MADAIAAFLSKSYEVVGISHNGREIVSLARDLRPDLVTLDIGMPELNGLEAARQIRGVLPRVKILFLTQRTDVTYLRNALQAGANAFIAKQAASNELKIAIEAVLNGRIFVTASLLRAADGSTMSLDELMQSRNQELTPRQREVLQLVAEGKTAKEIATLLGISPKTVEFHKQTLMNGLNLRSTAELTRYAIEHGFTFI